MAGCMLYWAEGGKGRNQVTLANADRAMMAFFARFLRDCFSVPDSAMAIRVNFYTANGHSQSEVEEHWLEAMRLPRSCLRKHTIDHLPTSSSGKRPNRLPYGTCTLRVSSTRIVQHIFGAIQEYAGFEDPRWLDGQ